MGLLVALVLLVAGTVQLTLAVGQGALGTALLVVGIVALRGLTTLAGVIDPGYRGELKVVITNLTGEPQTIAPGHRIAQLRVVERIQASFEETDDIAEAPRGTRGFGSTGV